MQLRFGSKTTSLERVLYQWWSWSAPTTISNTGASSPMLGIDSSGNVTALWLENGVVSSASLPFGGSWSAEVAVSSSGSSSPALAVDHSGNAVAIWVRGGVDRIVNAAFWWQLESCGSAYD